MNDLGLAQQLTGDYPAAASSHQQALQLYRDLGSRLGVAEALNNLGQLAARTADARHARDYYTQALAIAHDIGVPLEQARALEGIGRCDLAGGSPAQGAAYLR
jgi:tetratricopeptide (TPR) repeat protein